MKWIILILVVFVIVIGSDDTPMVPIGVHNSQHDCTQNIAERFIFSAATLIYGSPYTKKVIATDESRIVICQDLDHDGVCEPRTIFTCRNAVQYVTKDAERHGLKQLTPDDARDILHWPEIVLVMMMIVCLVLYLMGSSAQKA